MVKKMSVDSDESNQEAHRGSTRSGHFERQVDRSVMRGDRGEGPPWRGLDQAGPSRIRDPGNSGEGPGPFIGDHKGKDTGKANAGHDAQTFLPQNHPNNWGFGIEGDQSSFITVDRAPNNADDAQKDGLTTQRPNFSQTRYKETHTNIHDGCTEPLGRESPSFDWRVKEDYGAERWETKPVYHLGLVQYSGEQINKNNNNFNVSNNLPLNYRKISQFGETKNESAQRSGQLVKNSNLGNGIRKVHFSGEDFFDRRECYQQNSKDEPFFEPFVHPRRDRFFEENAGSTARQERMNNNDHILNSFTQALNNFAMRQGDNRRGGLRKGDLPEFDRTDMRGSLLTFENLMSAYGIDTEESRLREAMFFFPKEFTGSYIRTAGPLCTYEGLRSYILENSMDMHPIHRPEKLGPKIDYLQVLSLAQKKANVSPDELLKFCIIDSLPFTLAHEMRKNLYLNLSEFKRALAALCGLNQPQQNNNSNPQNKRGRSFSTGQTSNLSNVNRQATKDTTPLQNSGGGQRCFFHTRFGRGAWSCEGPPCVDYPPVGQPPYATGNYQNQKNE